MKTILSLVLLSSTLTLRAAENLVLDIYQGGALGGRIHYNANPGKSDKGIQHIERLPMDRVQVGPTQQEGMGMGFLMGFVTTPEFRQHIAADGKVRLALNVVGTVGGGAPADPVVALLNIGATTTHDHYPQFGAFNKAIDFATAGTIDADPEEGLLEIDVSEALHNSKRQPSAEEPMIWFVVYVPVEKLGPAEPRHILLDGRPRLIGVK